MLAGGDLRAALHDLALEVGGIHFELLNQFAVDQECRMRRLGLVRTVAVQHQAETVLGVHREAVDKVRGVQRAQAGQIVVDRSLGSADLPRVSLRRTGAGSGRPTASASPVRRIAVRTERSAASTYFSSSTGERFRASLMLSKPKAACIRRKIVGRADIDAEQIADGVVVFGAVQAAGRDPPSLRFQPFVLPGKFILQPAGDRRGGFGLRMRHAWQEASVQVSVFRQRSPMSRDRSRMCLRLSEKSDRGRRPWSDAL